MSGHVLIAKSARCDWRVAIVLTSQLGKVAIEEVRLKGDSAKAAFFALNPTLPNFELTEPAKRA